MPTYLQSIICLHLEVKYRKINKLFKLSLKPQCCILKPAKNDPTFSLVKLFFNPMFVSISLLFTTSLKPGG